MICLNTYRPRFTMTGVDRLEEAVEEINKKADELSNLIYDFKRLSLEFGVEMIPKKEEEKITQTDQT